MCYQDANDKAIFSDTVIILGLPIEFILLKHVVGLSFALLNAMSFSLTAHFFKETEARLRGPWLPGRVGPHAAEGVTAAGAGEAEGGSRGTRLRLC